MTQPPAVPHVRVPKTLFDDILAGRFTGNQQNIVWCVLRFTFGHLGQADGARISCRFIAQRTQIHERTVRLLVGELVAEGVILEAEPARGRQPAKIALQVDAFRWGKHSPNAPPLRRGGNLGNLEPYQFGKGKSAHPHAHNTDGLCACRSAGLAGADARTECGCRRADSEEELKVLPLKAPDSGSSCEPPLSATSEEGRRAKSDEGRRMFKDYLDRRHEEDRQAKLDRALGRER